MPRFMGPYTVKYARKLRMRSYARRIAARRNRAVLPSSRFNRRSNMRTSRFAKMPDEVKFFDTNMAFNFDFVAEIPATGGQLALIPQGDTQSTRDGRLARITSIQVRGYVDSTTQAAGGPYPQPLVYFWVILDKQANGAAAAVADVFTSTDASQMLINLNNSQRFTILHKETICPSHVGYIIPGAVGTTVVNLTWAVEFYKKVNILMDWDSTTGAITEIKSNNIFIIAGCGQAVNDDIYRFLGQARVRFVG